VHIPREDVSALPRGSLPLGGRVEVPPGTTPRALQPDRRVTVEVPAETPLPRRLTKRRAEPSR
jgi:uncharacterized membrane protein